MGGDDLAWLVFNCDTVADRAKLLGMILEESKIPGSITSLPDGWEETFDGEPFYVNKSGQPWTSPDGTKVPHGEGTHTRPSPKGPNQYLHDYIQRKIPSPKGSTWLSSTDGDRFKRKKDLMNAERKAAAENGGLPFKKYTLAEFIVFSKDALHLQELWDELVSNLAE